MRRTMLLTAGSAVLLCGQTMYAQGTTPQPPEARPPVISASGEGEVQVKPDRARIRIAVQTSAPTAIAAASENASRANAVMAALKKAGIAQDQLSTSGYDISPQYRYGNNEPPTLTGYQVTNSVVAEVRDVSQVGRVLDAAVKSGANLVSSLEFYVSKPDSARQAGIAQAVTQARSEAEAAARAAGGTLGRLVSLQIIGGGFQPPPAPPRPMMARVAGVESTSISPGQATISVNVSGQWQFVPGR